MGKKRELSIVRQCQFLEMSRTGYYYEPVPKSAENLALMRLIDSGISKYRLAPITFLKGNTL
jgi:hypothetical protein